MAGVGDNWNGPPCRGVTNGADLKSKMMFVHRFTHLSTDHIVMSWEEPIGSLNSRIPGIPRKSRLPVGGVATSAHICVHSLPTSVPRLLGSSHSGGADIPKTGELESLRGLPDGVMVTRALHAGERLPDAAGRRREQ